MPERGEILARDPHRPLSDGDAIGPVADGRYAEESVTLAPGDRLVLFTDGTRLDILVEDSEAEPSLPPAAFEAPPHEGYRKVDADEARRLWGGR